MTDYRLYSRLIVISIIQNIVALFFLLVTLVLYGVFGYLFFRFILLLGSVPSLLWTGLVLTTILADMARYWTMEKKGQSVDFEFTLIRFFWLCLGIIFFMVAHLWIILQKFVFSQKETKYYSIHILDHLFRQRCAVLVNDLTMVIWEQLGAKKKYSSEEEKNRAWKQVSTGLLKGLGLLKKLKLINVLWLNIKGEKRLVFFLTPKGEAFMLGFHETEEEN